MVATDPEPQHPPRRRSLLGPSRGLDLILLAIPPLSAVRLRLEAGEVGDEILAAHLLVSFLGPYLVVAALLFGLRPELLSRAEAPTPGQLLRASTVRVTALVIVTLASLRVLVIPDLAYVSGPFWRLLLWMGALALPLWTTTLLLRLRGVLTWRALGVTLLVLGGFAAGALALGVATVLPPAGMAVPLAVGGAVYSVGIWVAAWRRVEGGWLQVEVATAAAAVAVSTVLGFRVADPPLDTVAVTALLAFDEQGQRVAFGVERSLSRFYGMAEYELETGRWREFERSVDLVAYAQGCRIVARRSGVSYTLDTMGAVTLCREDPAGEVCGVKLGPGPRLLVRGHTRAPLVVAHRGRELVAWDLESDRIWKQVRGGLIRWPCFGADRSLYWRVQAGDPPYTQEILRLDDVAPEPRTLPLIHGEGCEDRGQVEPAARFVRGRHLAGTPSTLEGPGLAGGRVEIPEQVGQSVWSADGQVLALMLQGEMVRYYTPGSGLGPALPMDGNTGLALSPDGAMVAFIVVGEPHDRVIVRSVPDNQVVAEMPGEGRVLWTGDDRLLFIQEQQLVRLDPVGGAREILFPPP